MIYRIQVYAVIAALLLGLFGWQYMHIKTLKAENAMHEAAAIQAEHQARVLASDLKRVTERSQFSDELLSVREAERSQAMQLAQDAQAKYRNIQKGKRDDPQNCSARTIDDDILHWLHDSIDARQPGGGPSPASGTDAGLPRATTASDSVGRYAATGAGFVYGFTRL